ncbi:hypothetical protein ACSSS7_002090 [Eimeria intestinalis]
MQRSQLPLLLLLLLHQAESSSGSSSSSGRGPTTVPSSRSNGLPNSYAQILLLLLLPLLLLLHAASGSAAAAAAATGAAFGEKGRVGAVFLTVSLSNHFAAALVLQQERSSSRPIVLKEALRAQGPTPNCPLPAAAPAARLMKDKASMTSAVIAAALHAFTPSCV